MAASLTMFSAAQHLINPIIEAAGLEPLDFRVCLDHGPITVAQVGAARGFNGIVAIGATANVAAKMLSAAKANEILVGANVLDGLPLEWRLQYTKLQTTETGWFYRQTEIPYPFWRYEGRWVLPAIAQSEAA